jgi:phosphoenolpyruvate carboxykinase (ATP)
VVDGYIGWNPNNRFKVRTFCTRSYHALFMHNMLVRPTEKELQEDFTKGVDIHVFNGGEMAVSKHIPGVGSNAITAMNLTERKLAIMGTQYAGEMKKALFKFIHYILPRKGALTLRASATIGPTGKVAVICGRSATGKSALFMDNDRKIISDDELVWSDSGVSGVEGGCYVKIHAHDAKERTPVDNAIKYGTLLENVNFYPDTRDVNYSDSSSTHNLRAVFPLNFLPSAAIPPVGGHPEHFIILTCDQTGVLPLASKLTPEQAAYYFISGYTSKLSDPKNPEPTFSACFGESSLPLSPSVYANLFYEKIKKHGTKVWLINSG